MMIYLLLVLAASLSNGKQVQALEKLDKSEVIVSQRIESNNINPQNIFAYNLRDRDNKTENKIIKIKGNSTYLLKFDSLTEGNYSFKIDVNSDSASEFDLDNVTYIINVQAYVGENGALKYMTTVMNEKSKEKVDTINFVHHLKEKPKANSSLPMTGEKNTLLYSILGLICLHLSYLLKRKIE